MISEVLTVDIFCAGFYNKRQGNNTEKVEGKVICLLEFG